MRLGFILIGAEIDGSDLLLKCKHPEQSSEVLDLKCGIYQASADNLQKNGKNNKALMHDGTKESHLINSEVKEIIKAELTKLLSKVTKGSQSGQSKRPAGIKVNNLAADVADGLTTLEGRLPQPNAEVDKATVSKRNTRKKGKPALLQKIKKGKKVKVGHRKKKNGQEPELAKSRRRHLEEVDFIKDERIEALMKNPKVAATIGKAAKKLERFFTGHSSGARDKVNLIMKDLIKAKLAILLSSALKDQLQNKHLDVNDAQLVSYVDEGLATLENGLLALSIDMEKTLSHSGSKWRTKKGSTSSGRNYKTGLGLINRKKQGLDKKRNKMPRGRKHKNKPVLSALEDMKKKATGMKNLFAGSSQELRNQVSSLIKNRLKAKLAEMLSDQRRGGSSGAQLESDYKMDKLIDEIAESLSLVEDGMLDLIESAELNSLNKHLQQDKRQTKTKQKVDKKKKSSVKYGGKRAKSKSKKKNVGVSSKKAAVGSKHTNKDKDRQVSKRRYTKLHVDNTVDVKELAKEVGEGLSELEGRLTELKTVKNKAKRQRSRRELNENTSFPNEPCSRHDSLSEAEKLKKGTLSQSSSGNGNPECNSSSVLTSAGEVAQEKSASQLKSREKTGLATLSVNMTEIGDIFKKERSRLDNDLNPATEDHPLKEMVEDLRNYAQQISVISLLVDSHLTTEHKPEPSKYDTIDWVLLEMLGQFSDFKTILELKLVIAWAESSAEPHSSWMVYTELLNSYSAELRGVATQVNETKSMAGRPLSKVAKIGRLGRAFAAKKAFLDTLEKMKADSGVRRDYRKARKKDYGNDGKYLFKKGGPLLVKPMSLNGLIELVQEELKHDFLV